MIAFIHYTQGVRGEYSSSNSIIHHALADLRYINRDSHRWATLDISNFCEVRIEMEVGFIERGIRQHKVITRIYYQRANGLVEYGTIAHS